MIICLCVELLNLGRVFFLVIGVLVVLVVKVICFIKFFGLYKVWEGCLRFCILKYVKFSVMLYFVNSWVMGVYLFFV